MININVMKMKYIAAFVSSLILSSCEAPFTMSGPWGNLSQDADGNVTGVYVPKTKPQVEVKNTK
jgi:hypothetical protein